MSPGADNRGVRGLTILAGLFLLLWGALVALTIVLVVRALDGSTPWGYAVASGVGAAVCLFVAMLAWSRRAAVRWGEVGPRRPPSHRA